jgi:hypothetical protein
MAKRRKTGLPRSEWKKIFADAAKHCAKNRAPGERIQDCIRKYLAQYTGKVPVKA